MCHVWERLQVPVGFWWGDLRERNHLEVLGIDWRMILKWIFMKWDRGMEWTDLAQKKERWLVLVNVVSIRGHTR